MNTLHTRLSGVLVHPTSFPPHMVSEISARGLMTLSTF